MTDEEFIEKLNKAANMIHKKSLEPRANFIVVGLKQAEALIEIEINQDARNLNNERAKKLKDILDEPE